MSQDTAPARPFARHRARLALAALTLPAVLALAGCDGTNAAAPAAAIAVGPASDSTSVHSAVCGKVESAWAVFARKADSVTVEKTSAGRKISVVKINYAPYGKLSTALYNALTGNRDFQLAYDVDNLATDAGTIFGDPGQHQSPTKDLAAFKKDAPLVAKQCGTTLKVPAS